MKQSIARKIFYGFGLVVINIIAIVAVMITISHNNEHLNKDINRIYSPSVARLNEMKNLIAESNMLIKNWVYIDRVSDTPDKLKLKELHNVHYPLIENQLQSMYVNWSVDERDTFDVILKTIEDTIFKQQAFIMEKLSAMNSYDDPLILINVMPLVENNSFLLKATQQTLQNIDDLLNIQQKKEDSALTEMQDSFLRFQAITLIVGIFVILATILISIILGRSIIYPLRKCVKFAQSIESGDLTAHIDIVQKDEIGDLAIALKHMSDKLNKVIGEFSSVTETLSESSSNISYSSKNLSINASNQAASSEEISSSIEEIASNIEQYTENSKQTEQISIHAASEIMRVNLMAKESAASMKKISDKISIIGDIAFQTNILALNAAVEAARAGENGRGFAVVAAEVRKLAERSKLAAEEISILTKKSLFDSENSSRHLEMIVPEIEKTVRLIEEITVANIDQTCSIDQINMSIQQLNHITQESAAASDLLASNSTDLSTLSQQLKETINYFKI